MVCMQNLWASRLKRHYIWCEPKYESELLSNKAWILPNITHQWQGRKLIFFPRKYGKRLSIARFFFSKHKSKWILYAYTSLEAFIYILNFRVRLVQLYAWANSICIVYKFLWMGQDSFFFCCRHSSGKSMKFYLWLWDVGL